MGTAWMWDVEHQVYGREIFGLNIDTKKGTLHWYQGDPGSLCGDDDGYLEQSIREFQRSGVPPSIGELPEDVAKDLNQTIQMLA